MNRSGLILDSHAYWLSALLKAMEQGSAGEIYLTELKFSSGMILDLISIFISRLLSVFVFVYLAKG